MKSNFQGVFARKHNSVSTYLLNMFSSYNRGLGKGKRNMFSSYNRGLGKGKRAAFRECFSHLSEHRRFGPQRPVAPILGLTATATKKTQEKVLQTLSFRQGYVLIEEPLNRRNIYDLSKARISKNYKLAFRFLLDKLKMDKQNMERTIVYCRSVKQSASLCSRFKSELGSNAYPDNMEHRSRNCLFAMFHHCISEIIKTQILESLHLASGVCRLVFATNALGMGVNFKDICFIIHFGPS